MKRPVHAIRERTLQAVDDPLADEDLNLALYLCYELHYRGQPGVDERWEWEPSLLALRAKLEQQFEEALRGAVPVVDEPVSGQDIDLVLREIAGESGPPSLSSFVRSRASLEQVREFLVHRSAYQLKEADPHSWAIPRLWGAPKAALVEVQADEYGGGRAEWIHADLFARAMGAAGLDPTYGAYVDLIPGFTLATVNLMSLFGLHRRLRGAIVGHLALFEMTSSIPNRRYADGLRRLGLGADATLFFDEHVEADAVHENIAAVDLAGGLVGQDPSVGPSVIWGARALAHLEERWSARLLEAWRSGRSSLLGPLELGGGSPLVQMHTV
ncbi:MAG: iron-containing redox enzyme family protein [Actinomycetota bacterium]|nr:iron-containing redox enzyme family protein [Actinomycetota bacterium]